jgi:ABC-type dipeptide/oligopeptide/nickel transport system permease component
MAALLATILRRLVLGLPTLFGVVVVSFALTRVIPRSISRAQRRRRRPSPTCAGRCCWIDRYLSSSRPILATCCREISGARW